MNYTPNTRRWQPGDIVLHDADAKRVEMLMVVIGYHRKTGECITRYRKVGYIQGMSETYRNESKYLHDPALFGLEVSA
jgi:hypothetical protein